MYKAGWDAGWLARRSPVPPSAPTPDAAALIEEALIEFFRTRWRDGEVVKMLHYDGTLGREAAAHVAAALRVSAPETVITVEELDALPVGSVIMTTYDRGRSIERRVWQKFGQEPEWQFGMPRWEWQSTDGGFQRERAHSSIIGPAGFARVLFRPTREEGERP
jgi:hypothetical protein